MGRHLEGAGLQQTLGHGGPVRGAEVVAAAGAGATPVEQELLGAQARQARPLVEDVGVAYYLVPALGRVDVRLDDEDFFTLAPRAARSRVSNTVTEIVW